MISDAEDKGVEIIVFPELCITGYTCQDLFRSDVLLSKSEEALISLLSSTRKMDIISIVGMPVAVDGMLLNCAVVLHKGCIIGIVPKTYLPNTVNFMRNVGLRQHRIFPTIVNCISQAVLPSCHPGQRSSQLSTVLSSALRYVRTFGHPFRRAITLPLRELTSSSTSRQATS